jgi:hypothetical protein
LSGDQSLLEKTAVDLSITLGYSGKKLHLISLIKVLFDLVVIQTYLLCPATDDDQIYYLACKYSNEEKILLAREGNCYYSAQVGHLKQYLSFPEQALAAAQGSSDTCFRPVYSTYTHALKGMELRTSKTTSVIPLFSQGMQPLSAHNEDGSHFIWPSTSEPNHFTLANEELYNLNPLQFSTPQAQVTSVIPDMSPPIPIKQRNETSNEIEDHSPYNLESRKRPHADSWEAVDFVENM